jgi:hypothetical protein
MKSQIRQWPIRGAWVIPKSRIWHLALFKVLAAFPATGLNQMLAVKTR